MAVRKTKKGASLKRWFKEEWIDVRTGKPCGRRKGEKRGTPYCRPKKRVSSATPKTASEMSAAEKRKKIAEKKRLGQPAGKPRRVKNVKRKKMNLSELRLYFINGSTLGVTTFTQIEDSLKIILLLVTIGYTITKWKDLSLIHI